MGSDLPEIYRDQSEQTTVFIDALEKVTERDKINFRGVSKEELLGKLGGLTQKAQIERTKILKKESIANQRLVLQQARAQQRLIAVKHLEQNVAD